jgi:hypothetical protein
MADLQCHSQALVPADPRIGAFFACVERVLPDVRLEHVMGADHRWHGPVADRIERVSANLPVPSRRNALLGNGSYGPRHVLAIVSNVSDQRAGRSGWIAQCKLDVDDDSELPDALPDLLAQLAPAVRAHAGFVHSRLSRRQLFEDADCQAIRARGVLRLADGRLLVRELGWANYLDDATAALAGFPDAQDEAVLAGRLARIAAQGWSFRLTRESLDLRVPEHLALARWAHRRFAAPA